MNIFYKKDKEAIDSKDKKVKMQLYRRNKRKNNQKIYLGNAIFLYRNKYYIAYSLKKKQLPH